MRYNKKMISEFSLYFVCVFFEICLNLFSILFLGSLSLDLQGYCLFGIFCILFNLILWKICFKTFFSPYIIIFIISVIFCFGQPLAWGIGFFEGDRNLINYDISDLVYCVNYTICSLNLMHFGAMISLMSSKRKTKTNNVSDLKLSVILLRIGKIGVAISIIPFIVKYASSLVLTFRYGYAGGEEHIPDGFILNSLYFLSNYFMPSMILLLISKLLCGKKIKNILIPIILSIVLMLYCGGRSPVAMAIVAIIYAFISFKKQKVRLKTIILLFILGYFIIVLFNTIMIIRNDVNNSLSYYLSSFGENFYSAPLSLLYELGWNFSSLLFTRFYVPRSFGFRYGLSYVWGALNAIPNIGQWGNNIFKYSALSSWLTNLRNTGSGTGYTFIAETYINFGNLGIFMMFIWGLIFGKVLGKSNQSSLAKTFITLFFAIVLKGFIRSDISNVSRNFVWVFGIFCLIIFISIRSKQNEYGKC